MIEAAIPVNEQQRLAALQSMQLLDTREYQKFCVRA